MVMTHHAPSFRSVAPQFRDDLLTAAYASARDDLIERFQPALWAHGHTHVSFDYRIGRTRVVCNPRGYVPDEVNAGFDPGLVIALA
jgi:Icc-related predicted phosphoesterase